jgi:protein phosphatase inhibitor 2
MKITEPKTPYAKHYDPAEDPSDDEDPLADAGSRLKDSRPSREDDIPGLSLGEPEEAIPEAGAPSPRSEKSVHVDDESSIGHDAEEDLAGMSPEEREKHRKFEQLRKRHYEMKNVAQLLGHPDDLPEDEDEDDNVPPMPQVPQVPNGSA